MPLDVTIFQTHQPLQYVTFSIPNPTDTPTRLLRVAVLDSPLPPSAGIPPRTAALLVPAGRESDWIFSTLSGHLQLLLSPSPPVCRLILFGDDPPSGFQNPPALYSVKPINTQYVNSLVGALQPLFELLSFKTWSRNCDIRERITLLEYEDSVVSGLGLWMYTGEFVGEMLVEDVEIVTIRDGAVEEREFRRRLRFKSRPNLVQTEVRIVPSEGITGFRVDIENLVHSYLAPMVAALSLIGPLLDNRVRDKLKPKALCLGVGGGALVSFLAKQLDFEVDGVELDDVVVRVARDFFGLGGDYYGARLHVGDAMEFVTRIAREVHDTTEDDDGISFAAKFDVIMVDLDCCNLQTGASVPPVAFLQKNILLSAKSILSDSGVLVVNVISVFDWLINLFREIFDELYEIDVGNGENVVVIAKTSSTISSSSSSSIFVDKIRASISGKYMNSIRRI